MWLLPTRKRPDLMAALIAAMEAAGDVPRCAVMLDGCEPYRIKWPDNWDIHRSEEHLEMQGAINALFRLYPDEPFYGMLDDHTRPLGKWSAAMQQEAGDKFIASAWNVTNRTLNDRMRLNNYCMGGGLARALGWVWPDCVIHLFGDDILEDLGYKLNIIKFVKSALFQPYLLRDGTLEPDENSLRLFKGQPYGARDAQVYRAWRKWDFEPLSAKLTALGYCGK